MERKITHYVVKPEHREHCHTLLSEYQVLKDGFKLSVKDHDGYIRKLTEAKVLEIWAYPVYEKKRITGWLNIYEHTLIKTEHEADEVKGPQRICKVFIDQEIE